MSTKYDIRCLTCDLEDGSFRYINNHDSSYYDVPGLQDLIKNADTLAALAKIDDDGREILEIDRNKLQFFANHQGHKLAVYDEYGHAVGSCLQTKNCEYCGQWNALVCSLDENHNGKCQFVKPHPRP